MTAVGPDERFLLHLATFYNSQAKPFWHNGKNTHCHLFSDNIADGSGVILYFIMLPIPSRAVSVLSGRMLGDHNSREGKVIKPAVSRLTLSNPINVVTLSYLHICNRTKLP